MCSEPVALVERFKQEFEHRMSVLRSTSNDYLRRFEDAVREYKSSIPESERGKTLREIYGTHTSPSQEQLAQLVAEVSVNIESPVHRENEASSAGDSERPILHTPRKSYRRRLSFCKIATMKNRKPRSSARGCFKSVEMSGSDSTNTRAISITPPATPKRPVQFPFIEEGLIYWRFSRPGEEIFSLNGTPLLNTRKQVRSSEDIDVTLNIRQDDGTYISILAGEPITSPLPGVDPEEVRDMIRAINCCLGLDENDGLNDE